MAFNADSLLLFPLAFVAMVAQKTYAISKSALVPTVVRTEEELVEANSKLGLISGLVGAVAIVPAGILQKTIGADGDAAVRRGHLRLRLRGRHPAAARGDRRSLGEPHDERSELHSDRVVLASNAMLLLRCERRVHLLPPVLLVPRPGRRAGVVRSLARYSPAC